jgi:hypothetical protein
LQLQQGTITGLLVLPQLGVRRRALQRTRPGIGGGGVPRPGFHVEATELDPRGGALLPQRGAAVELLDEGAELLPAEVGADDGVGEPRPPHPRVVVVVHLLFSTEKKNLEAPP